MDCLFAPLQAFSLCISRGFRSFSKLPYSLISLQDASESGFTQALRFLANMTYP